MIEINRRRDDHDGRGNRIDPTHHRTRAADHLSRRHRRPLLGVRDGHQTFLATFAAVADAPDGAVIPTGRAAEVAEVAVAHCRYGKWSQGS